MIPRTKVNYTFPDLLRALFVSERGKAHKVNLAARLGELLGLPHVLPTPSGRAGLYFLLKAIEKPRVIVPAYTCKAVVEAARMAGREVVFVENDDCGFNSPYQEYERLVGEDSVVIATHQFGVPCEIKKICALAASRGAVVIEDAAASLGSRIDGRLTGTFGTAAFFSFDSTKLINAPMKGGAVATSDPGLFQRLQACYRAETSPMPAGLKIMLLLKAGVLLLLENHFLYRRFHRLYFEMRGKFTDDGPDVNLVKNPFYLHDMAEWQAEIVLRQLATFENIVKQRQSLYAEYWRRLVHCRSFTLPPKDESGEWACIRFPILVAGDKLDFYRRAVRLGLDFAFSFTFLGCPQQFAKARRLADQVLDLPFYLKLTPGELDEVVAILQAIDSEIKP